MALVSRAIFLRCLAAVLICAVVVLLFAASPDRRAFRHRDRACSSSRRWSRSAPASRLPGRDQRRLTRRAHPLRAPGSMRRTRTSSPPRQGLQRLPIGAASTGVPTLMNFDGPRPASHVLDRVLVLEMVRVTEAAAIAASKWIGRGDKDAADAGRGRGDARGAQRAADRRHRRHRRGRARRGADALHRREGRRARRAPARRSTSRSTRSKARRSPPRPGPTRSPSSRSPRRAACSTRPTSTWTSSRSARAIPRASIDLAKSPTDNIRAVAAAKGVEPAEIIVCVLDRPRHDELIAELRGARLRHPADPRRRRRRRDRRDRSRTPTIDVYMGTGGAPEGVLAAAALRCVGGQIQGRLLFRNDDETRPRAPLGHRGSRPHLQARGDGQGRLHLRRDRRHRRLAARRRPAPQELHHHRKHRDARKLGHRPPGQRRASQGRLKLGNRRIIDL